MRIVGRMGPGVAITLICAIAINASYSTSSNAESPSAPSAEASPSPLPVEIEVKTTDSLGQGVIGSGIKIHGGSGAGSDSVTQSGSSQSGAGGTEQGSDDDSNPDPIVIGPGQCNWHIVNPPAGDVGWEGNDPATGIVIENNCDGPVRTLFLEVPNSTASPGVPSPPSAEELAKRAYRQIVMPLPHINAGPDRTRLAVNLWTWLWINDAEPQTVTVSAGGVSVTLTAALDSVTWSLGEPASTGGPYAPGPPVTLTCQGTGTSPPADYDWKAEPPCGHKYAWMSTADRTGGSGKWPITATSNWNVTWQSNTGVSGSTVLNASSSDALEIGEYRVVLVQGAGG